MGKQVRRILIAGRQACGKTTLARELAQKIPWDKKKVIQPDEGGDIFEGWDIIDYTQINEKGNGIVVFDSYNKDFLKYMGDQDTGPVNSVLIFDDVLFLINGTTKYADLSKILGRARQRNNYVIFICHGLSIVPAPFWAYFTDLILFKTLDKPERSAYKVPAMDDLVTIYNRVNKNPNQHYFERIKLVP